MEVEVGKYRKPKDGGDAVAPTQDDRSGMGTGAAASGAGLDGMDFDALDQEEEELLAGLAGAGDGTDAGAADGGQKRNAAILELTEKRAIKRLKKHHGPSKCG